MAKTTSPREHNMVGVRMPIDLRDKLEALCSATQQTPSSVIRALIRLAEPTHAPQFRLRHHDDEQECEFGSGGECKEYPRGCPCGAKAMGQRVTGP